MDGRFWFRIMLSALLCLNVIDGMLTLFWVSKGIAIEANPLLLPLILASPVGFMLVKLLLVSLGVYVLWSTWPRMLSVVAGMLCLMTYMLVFGYHLTAIQDVYDVPQITQIMNELMK